MQKCTQPGCTGQIVDSVCEVCGHFYATLPTSAAGAARVLAVAPRTCAQPSCHGRIVDGICENCGYDYSGLPTSAAPSAPASASISVGPPTSNRCTQPGCNGKIVDSICEVCGHYYDTLPTKPATTTLRPGLTGRISTQSTRLARSTQGSGSQTRRIQRVGIDLLLSLGVQPVVANVRLIPPVVPPDRRVCGNCGQRLAEERGVCQKCGKPYSFVPQLQADPAHPLLGRFEIKGTMAFGGMGWIFLAHDRLLGRDIVLKGLKDSQDPELAAIAAREREFLAQVKHPSIVEIYDFLVNAGQGYIVMELVEGRTLDGLRKDQGGVLDPLEACTYILEILPALGYLDSKDLVHCDFKPENVMVQSNRVKLIDLGTVRRVDDTSDVYGSPGYSSPEANDGSPSPLSDLWSAGKSLASLVADFDYKGKYRFSLPPPSEVPLFREHESLYHFLAKATREEPEERFQTAEEMAQQLAGVIRQILRDRGGLPPIESALFADDLATRDGITPVGPDSLSFPSRKPDPTDPATPLIAVTFPIPDPARRREAYESARLTQSVESVELALQLAGENVAYGELATTSPRAAKLKETGKNYSVEQILARARETNARDWRVSWFEAQLAFARGDLARARGV
ncbi:MAG TPA: protein kinase, partial [Chloroflexota bacterium]|nr:protein kinase [Chloroflexota bacterium]